MMGITTCLVRVANATVMPPPPPSRTPVIPIGAPSDSGTATAVHDFVNATCCVHPDASTATTSPSGSMLSVNTIQPMRRSRANTERSTSCRCGTGNFRLASADARPAPSSLETIVTMSSFRSAWLDGGARSFVSDELKKYTPAQISPTASRTGALTAGRRTAANIGGSSCGTSCDRDSSIHIPADCTGRLHSDHECSVNLSWRLLL